MSRLYAVEVEGIGSVQVSRACIADARAWAAKAFGKTATKVSPVVRRRPNCQSCDCRPCLCPPSRSK